MIELIKRNLYLITSMVLFLSLIMVLSLRWSRPATLQWIDESYSAIVYPFQTVYHSTTETVQGFFGNYIQILDVREENRRLRLQVKALQEEVNHYINSSIQFNLLREQLKFLEENPEPKIFAEVIGESVDSLHHTLLINKGHRAGIRRNFPVVLREGVVGRVQSATAFSASVQLLVDRRHRFPVLIQRSRERLILRGEGGRLTLVAQDRGIVYGTGQELRMDRIRMLADVKVGDRVITSGLAGIFPKGLLVGLVTSVGRANHELFQSAVIEPIVDFDKIEGVFVILREEKGDAAPFFQR